MNELAVTSYVKTGIALQGLRDRLEARRERGADALEYVGMVVVAAIIVVAIATAAQSFGLQDIISAQITKISGLNP